MIQSISVDEANNQLVLTSQSFQASNQVVYPPEHRAATSCLLNNSFTREEDDYDANGNYNHEPPVPGEKPWRKLDLDVDPWQDQTFEAGKVLTFADLYTCSCPSHLRAIIRNPEVYDERGGKLNRQARAPFPTAKGVNDFDIAGVARAAGIAQTWSDHELIAGVLAQLSIQLQRCLLIRFEYKNPTHSHQQRQEKIP